ncbi:MAG: helix-turn-helix domain-containing protein [Nannocystis sp.]|uniref:helix-turn-helix domain-containing protein n=1 Tax=Nannocystis sp. TaxID=1962667 RepID=UPI0024211D92|nr:hypothetical protein [Nannocystis sp.]MBK9754407.1 helix-turn-helix domain-containing protein [Nannocystis sp.]
MTTSRASDLNLLMVHADDHAPVLADGLAESTACGQSIPTQSDEASHFWDEGGDPNDIEVQRWGVIAPQGPEGDRLLALIKPLMAHRQAQQQGEPIKVYRAPPQMTQDEAMRWKKREFDTGADLNIEVPRYQLILGDLDQVPLALQQVQASDGYVGRLAFDKAEDYAAYVDKVLRWERSAAGRDKPDSLFFTVHDGTAATAVGHRALVAPGVEVVRKRQRSGQYPAKDIVEFGDPVTPSPDELLARAEGQEASVLFTLSHGEGAPRGGWSSPEEQRRRQGAMSFGREGRICGEDLRSRPFMPGGVWFMLACYGAGTPNSSAYKHWLAALAAAGQFRGKPEAVLAGLPGPRDRPFTSALAQAVLANPNGPLGFMSHIDLAWTYSFQELDSGATNRPARYMAITRSILKRDRVGVAMRELLRFFDQTNVELTSLYDQEARQRSAGEPVQVDAARQGHLWMLRQDLAAYVLLGDPAVRLPDGGSAGGPTSPAATAAPITVTTAAAAEPASPAATPAPITVTTAPVAEPASPAPAPAAIVAAPGPAAVAAASSDSFAIPAPAASAARPAVPVADTPRDAAVDASQVALEEAVAQCILADLAVTSAAARVGLSRDALTQLVARYREIGRRALVGGE